MGKSDKTYRIEVNGRAVKDLRNLNEAEARGAVLFAGASGFRANVASVCNETGMVEESVGTAVPDVPESETKTEKVASEMPEEEKRECPRCASDNVTGEEGWYDADAGYMRHFCECLDCGHKFEAR